MILEDFTCLAGQSRPVSRGYPLVCTTSFVEVHVMKDFLLGFTPLAFVIPMTAARQQWFRIEVFLLLDEPSFSVDESHLPFHND